MKDKTLINKAVVQSISSTTSKNIRAKNGRPELSTYEKLFSNAFISYKEYAVLNEKIMIQIDISSGENLDKKDELAKIQQQRMQITKSVVSIESNIKNCKNPSLKEKLKKGRDNKIKQLRKLPSEGEHSMDLDKKNSVGKPKLPLVVYFVRAKLAYEDELKNLNNYEKKHNIFPSSMTDFKDKLVDSKNKPKIGRPTSTEIDILDTELRSILNTIYQIKKNIAEEALSELKLGRKKRTYNALENEEKKQECIISKILKLESKMSAEQLMRRRIKQQQKLITTAKKKIKYADIHETQMLNRQIFDNKMKIKEINMKLEHLDVFDQSPNANPESVNTKADIQESKNNEKAHLVSIDDLFSQIEKEKIKLDERIEFLTAFVNKFAANDKLKIA